jgi:PiT family inorganic phosphate transporter
MTSPARPAAEEVKSVSFLLLLAAAFLAFANGADDNFKGVASLYGSGLASYRAALTWATVMTVAGSLCSFILAEALLQRFTGKGLVPDALVVSQPFVLAVAAAAAATVLLASRLGFPVSTTHALLGAMAGAGLAAAGVSALSLGSLGKGFLAPLLLGPIVALSLAGLAYALIDRLRPRFRAARTDCLCIGVEASLIATGAAGTLVVTRSAGPVVRLEALPVDDCVAQSPGAVIGVQASRLLDGLHWASAGAVSFARGLNDTPKIAALLLIVRTVTPAWDIALVATAMAIGGLLGARKVAETMSHRITKLDPTEGLVANITTAALVLSASVFGLPMSTTHVSVGSLFGIAATTRQANTHMMRGIVLSWVITLPCAAALGAALVTVLRLAGQQRGPGPKGEALREDCAWDYRRLWIV